VGEIGVLPPKVIQHEVLLTKKSLEHVLHDEEPSYLLLCQGTLTCTSSESSSKSLPPSIENLWKVFKDIFPKEGPLGLQHLGELSIKLILYLSMTKPSGMWCEFMDLRSRSISRRTCFTLHNFICIPFQGAFNLYLGACFLL